jgi:hypothetical protein
VITLDRRTVSTRSTSTLDYHTPFTNLFLLKVCTISLTTPFRLLSPSHPPQSSIQSFESPDHSQFRSLVTFIFTNFNLTFLSTLPAPTCGVITSPPQKLLVINLPSIIFLHLFLSPNPSSTAFLHQLFFQKSSTFPLPLQQSTHLVCASSLRNSQHH